MNIKEVNKEEFIKEIKNDKVLVDFFATWCPPCKALAPILEEFANKNEHVRVLKVNVDENQELAIQYDVMSVPTLIYFDNGNEVDRIIGYTTIDNIENLVK